MRKQLIRTNQTYSQKIWNIKIERSQIDGKGLFIKILQFLHSKKNSLGLKFFRDRKDSRRIK